MKDITDAEVGTDKYAGSPIVFKMAASDVSEETVEEGSISLPVPFVKLEYSGDTGDAVMNFGRVELGTEAVRYIRFTDAVTENLTISDLVSERGLSILLTSTNSTMSPISQPLHECNGKNARVCACNN